MLVDEAHEGQLILRSASCTDGEPDISVGFDRSTGLLCSLRFRGVERLAAPMEPSAWRPLTDNDLVRG